MEIRFSGLFDDWQKNARELLKKNVPPRDVVWSEESGQQGLFGHESRETSDSGGDGAIEQTWGAPFEAQGRAVLRPYTEVTKEVGATSSVNVPKRFIELARNVAAFRDAKKWDLLYSVLWRIAHENHHLL